METATATTGTYTTKLGAYTIDSIGWTKVRDGHVKIVAGAIIRKTTAYNGRRPQTRYSVVNGTGSFVTRVGDIAGLVANQPARVKI